MATVKDKAKEEKILQLRKAGAEGQDGIGTARDRHRTGFRRGENPNKLQNARFVCNEAQDRLQEFYGRGIEHLQIYRTYGRTTRKWRREW